MGEISRVLRAEAALVGAGAVFVLSDLMVALFTLLPLYALGRVFHPVAWVAAAAGLFFIFAFLVLPFPLILWLMNKRPSALAATSAGRGVWNAAADLVTDGPAYIFWLAPLVRRIWPRAGN